MAPQRQGNEARYRALIDSTLDSIVGMDAQGRITEFNGAAERTFGYSRAAALGQRVADLIIPDRYRAQHEQGLARYLASGESVILGQRVHFTALRADGSEFPIELSVVRLPAEGDEPTQFMAAIRDLTDLRREEEQRARALAEAEAARNLAASQTAALAETFGAMSDGVLVYDLDGGIILSNTAAQTMLGYDRESNFTQLPLAERAARVPVRNADGRLLSIAELPQFRALRGESFTGADAMDLRIRTLYDTELEVNCSAAPLRGANGTLLGAIAVYHDVTERQRMERELNERAHDLEAANGRLRAVLDVLPIGVIIVDANGAFVEVNAMGKAIWGENAPMLQSLDEYDTYVGWWHETGRRIAPEEWAVTRALTKGERSIGEEIRIQAFDGQIRVALSSTVPIHDAQGAIVGAVVALVDVTERMQLTERTRQTLDGFLAITQSLVGAGVEDSDGESDSALGAESDVGATERSITWRLAELTRNVLGCSRVVISGLEGERLMMRQVAIVGLTPQQEREWLEERQRQTEQSALETTPPEMLAQLQAGDPVVLDMTQPPYNTRPNPYGTTTALVMPMSIQGRMVGMLVLDYLEIGEDGRNMPHHFSDQEIQLAEVVARLGAVVLERERLLREREVARANTMALQELNKRMDEFIGIAGHELRTPLTSVKANVQLAERRARTLDAELGDTPGVGQQLTRLVHLLANVAVGVERQERLVSDLLDISRISSGKLTYRMAPCELNALVRETAQEALLTTAERAITLDLPAAPMMTLADADRVQQVLTNYLTNALRYAPAGPPIAVTLRRDGEMARVEVTDQGPGLSPEQQRGLFERFHRAEGIEALSGSGVGLGLGLYISRTIVERHGGQVGVESAPGTGATFWFTLPLLKGKG